jgi:hypothetical protein
VDSIHSNFFRAKIFSKVSARAKGQPETRSEHVSAANGTITDALQGYASKSPSALNVALVDFDRSGAVERQDRYPVADDGPEY